MANCVAAKIAEDWRNNLEREEFQMSYRQQELFEDAIIFPAGLIVSDAREVELLARLMDGLH